MNADPALANAVSIQLSNRFRPAAHARRLRLTITATPAVQRERTGHSFRFGLVGHDLDDLQTIGGERVADRVLGLGGLRGHLDRFDGRRLRLLGQGVLCGDEVFSAVATSSTVAFLLAETSFAAG